MWKYKHFLKYGNHFSNGNKCAGFEIKDRKTLIDINDPHDLRIGKASNKKNDVIFNMRKILGLRNCGIFCKNINKSLLFYKNILGLKVIQDFWGLWPIH